MEKQVYITEEEREKCRKVIDAFAELYEIENEDILVVDAGRYGFVKMQLDDIVGEEVFNILPKEKQSEFIGKKADFAQKADISL